MQTIPFGTVSLPEFHRDRFNEIIDIQAEIDSITKEMFDVSLESIPFDKYDFMAIFASGLLEVAADFFFGNPKDGIPKELSSKNNDSLGCYFNKIHDENKAFAHQGNPLDYQGAGYGGGHHRARTFSHDLLMLPFSIYMLCEGRFIDGLYKDNTWIKVNTAFNQYGNQYSGMSLDEAISAYVIHMTADFFSTHSLPVPGFSILAHFPSRDVRKTVADMYRDGFNLRNVALQGVPVLVTELLIRAYVYLRYFKSDYSDAAKRAKLNKMLLTTHSLATAINIGKVLITKNPLALNMPMIMRVVKLAWSVAKDEMAMTDRALQSINLGVLKNKYEALDTLLLLDDAIYYTKDVTAAMTYRASELRKSLNQKGEEVEVNYAEIDEIMAKFKMLT